jgi:hypothetical protein
MAVNCPFEITPYDLSTPITTTNIFNLNYTNQDFWSMKTRLIQFIQEQFAEDFNDFIESSLAIMLVENFSFVADTLSFKIDQIANEIFIDTVVEIDNAFRLSKLVGFEPLPPIASRSLWSAQIGSPLTADLVIPTPYNIEVGSATGTIPMELFPADANNNPIFDEDIIIPAGNLVNSTIVGLQGKTNTDLFSGDGSVAQTLNLSGVPVIFGSIRVFVNGLQWEEVDFFTDSQPRYEYRVEFDSSYSAFVIFGNNQAGAIPPPGAEIEVTYRVGGGTIGNIVTGAGESQGTIPIDVFPFASPVAFTNFTRGEFGYNGDTIEDIRSKLPEFLRTQNRAVTGLDYKTLADQFASPFHGQVGKSVAALRQYGCAANIVDLYVLAREGEDGLEEASNELKVELQEEMDSKKMLTDFVCIRDGIIILTDVNIDVNVNRSQRRFEDEIRTRMVRRLSDFFNLNNWEYGQDLKDTDVIKVLADVREITNFEISFETDDPNNSGQTVTAKFNEIIRPDTISITFIFD